LQPFFARSALAASVWRDALSTTRRRATSGRLRVLLFAGWLLLPVPGMAEDEAPAPEQAEAAIERLHGVLLAAMRDAEKLGFEGRLEQIRPAIARLYDFGFMAEKSVGLGWRQLDEPARARLVDAFSRLAIATYAARFDGWNGERFETLGVQTATHGTLLVRSRILRGNGEKVALDYRLRPVEGEWRIIDVFLNGTVSELALRRAEYSGVLKREGFDGLLRALEEKIAAQALGGETTS
jgi:phospholipid transport system substrate-binding protein